MSVMHYDQQRTDPYGGPCSSTEICELKTRNGVTGMNVDGTFDLGRGTFRPYLLSGAGIYRSRRTTYGDRTCLATCVSILYAWQQPSERIDASAGFHSGIGLTGKLGKTPVFAEMRVLLLASDPARARGMLPLTFGVKF
jgi:hypothetical protein